MPSGTSPPARRLTSGEPEDAKEARQLLDQVGDSARELGLAGLERRAAALQ